MGWMTKFQFLAGAEIVFFFATFKTYYSSCGQRLLLISLV